MAVWMDWSPTGRLLYPELKLPSSLVSMDWRTIATSEGSLAAAATATRAKRMNCFRRTNRDVNKLQSLPGGHQLTSFMVGRWSWFWVSWWTDFGVEQPTFYTLQRRWKVFQYVREGDSSDPVATTFEDQKVKGRWLFWSNRSLSQCQFEWSFRKICLVCGLLLKAIGLFLIKTLAIGVKRIQL